MIDFAHRILLLETDRLRRERVRESIQSQPRSSPILFFADAVDEALAVCRRERPDCALLSITHKHGEIERFLEGIDQLELSAPIPVIVLREEEDESRLSREPWTSRIQDDLAWETLTGSGLCRAVRNAIRLVALEFRVS